MVKRFYSPVNFSRVSNFNIALERFRKSLETWLNGYVTTVGVYTDWAPTFTNVTLGNGTYTARYTQIGNFVHMYFRFTLGSTSTVGTSPQISLPVAASSSFSTVTPGLANLLDNGTAVLRGGFRLTSTTAGIIYVDNSGSTYDTENSITATAPFTWTTSDAIIINFWYEAA